ncbi:MAG: hypothetical protein K1X55_05045 [Chitinophagales bacterium]|nr:hypothetical protein [Chitinophagales bacterium]
MQQNCSDKIPEFSVLDTIFDDGDAVKYVLIDSFYHIYVKIGEKTFKIEENFVNIDGYITPKFYYKFPSTILLERGHGFNYRSLFVCGNTGINEYVTYKTNESEYDFFVYKTDSKPNKILFIGNVKDSIFHKEINLPAKLSKFNIEEATIYPEKVFLKFKELHEFEIPLAGLNIPRSAVQE